MSLRTIVPLLTLGCAAACIESRDAPPRIPQATVTYGPRIFLVDDTREGQRPDSAWCTRLVAPVATSTTSTPTADLISVDDRGIVFDPRSNLGDRRTPASCFVEVEQKSLPVDQVETTNELFQLCVDSGFCQKPDPSKASKGQLCSNEDQFDSCPVLEVTQTEAARFCTWVGRRLPTGMEHYAIRQGNIGDRSDPAALFRYPTGNTPPSVCEQAVVKENGCLRPRPSSIQGESISGGAPDDVVQGDDGEIFDLMGNASEWTSDLHPNSRGPRGAVLPWFCLGPLSEEDFSQTNPPVCPATAQCVYGQYSPYPGAAYSIWPVCVVSDDGAFSGTRGALYGGAYGDESVEREILGIYSRRVEPEPEELPDTSRAQQYGFRCVDQRPSDDGNGVVNFDNTMTIVPPTL